MFIVVILSQIKIPLAGSRLSSCSQAPEPSSCPASSDVLCLLLSRKGCEEGRCCSPVTYREAQRHKRAAGLDVMDSVQLATPLFPSHSKIPGQSPGGNQAVKADSRTLIS